MNRPADPHRGPTTSLCPSHTRDVARIEFSVITKADCSLAWKVFSNCEKWNRFLAAYGKFQWRGKPWATGSRLRIDLMYPVAATQDRVITVCTPPRCVAWINHVLGYTMEQWVLFDPYPAGGTKVSIWIEFTGEALFPEGHDVRGLIVEFVEEWYTNFRAECDRMASRSGSLS